MSDPKIKLRDKLKTWLRTKLQKWLGIEQQQLQIQSLYFTLQAYGQPLEAIKAAQNQIIAMIEADRAKEKKPAKKKRK